MIFGLSIFENNIQYFGKGTGFKILHTNYDEDWIIVSGAEFLYNFEKFFDFHETFVVGYGVNH